MRSLFTFALLSMPFLPGCLCASIKPPRSLVPDAEAALARMRASQACGTGLQATAKIDHRGEQGRVRGELMMIVSRPANIRMDVLSPPPLMQPIATLTSDGRKFLFTDLRDKRVLSGTPSPCNIARLSTIPLPGFALVELLRGQAPLLVRGAEPATVAWNGRGYYDVRIPSTRRAVEHVHLAPHEADFDKPWQEQRFRVAEVRVEQYGEILYVADLTDYAPAPMAKERVDDAGIDPPVPPSGPHCEAELPRKISVEVPGTDQDVRFRYEELVWNPPTPDGTFTHLPPAGFPIVPVRCPEERP